MATTGIETAGKLMGYCYFDKDKSSLAIFMNVFKDLLVMQFLNFLRS